MDKNTMHIINQLGILENLDKLIACVSETSPSLIPK
jgi:hypothetical protein